MKNNHETNHEITILKEDLGEAIKADEECFDLFIVQGCPDDCQPWPEALLKRSKNGPDDVNPFNGVASSYIRRGIDVNLTDER